MKITELLPLKVYVYMYNLKLPFFKVELLAMPIMISSELQIRGSTEDNSKTIFLISQWKQYIVTPH